MTHSFHVCGVKYSVVEDQVLVIMPQLWCRLGVIRMK